MKSRYTPEMLGFEREIYRSKGELLRYPTEEEIIAKTVAANNNDLLFAI